ncbi:MAG: hypothetical protein KJI69_05500 [Patescibacteria group bacterium]|nr:hypothetical protein [Patescibacteria group bacterium]
MTRGFKDSNNKFHPITDSKGVRKSRDQKVKTQGVRLKRKNPRITFTLLDKTENQLYRLRDELSDQQEQETWQEVNGVIDKIQNYKMKYYGGTGSKFNPERKKRYDVCEAFLEDPASHRGDEPDHTNQVMYSLGDESCASVLSDEEFSMLLTDDQVANTFNPIGDTATKWQEDEAFRKRILDRALELIEEKKGDRKARDGIPSIMKSKTIKEFNTMTLSEATDFKKALGMEGVSIDFMDHRSKEYERLDKLHWKNVRNLSDSKWGSAVQDELQRRQMEKRGEQ